MKLKKFEIKKYRNIDNATIEFGDLTILIGKNNSGKSNILKALDLFFNFRDSGDIKEIQIEPISGAEMKYQIKKIKDNRIFFNLKPQKIELIATIELSADEIKKIFPYKKFRISSMQRTINRSNLGNIIVIEKVVYLGKDKSLVSEINCVSILDIDIFKSEGHRCLFLRNGKSEPVLYEYGATPSIANEIIQIVKQNFLKVPAAREISLEGRISGAAEPDGKNQPGEFLRMEKEAPLNEEIVYEKINEDMIKIFPEFKKFTSKTEDNEKKVAIYFDKFPSASVGYGVNQIFVIVFDIDSRKNMIFGIEEPEIHLHSGIQRKLFDFLKNQSKEKQIIITTHSPIFCDCSNKIKLHLVNKNAEGLAKVTPIKDRRDFKSIKYELGAKLIDLFFCGFVVVIEGKTEENAFPIIFECYGEENIGKLGMYLLNVEGKDKVKKTKIKEFLRYLKCFGIKTYIILDNDGKVKEYIEILIKSDLLKKGMYTIWEKGTFVDCFNEGQVIEAMKEITDGKFGMTEQELKNRRKNNQTEKILGDYMWEHKLGNLNKPDLGRQLAITLKNEIEVKGGEERKAISPETVVKKLIKLAEKNE